MFIGPGELLRRWGDFVDSRRRGLWLDRRCALSSLAARGCIERVLSMSHPSIGRFADSVDAIDEIIKGDLPLGVSGALNWWWSAAPPPPQQAPKFDSFELSVVTEEIWRQATNAGLTPFDMLTFTSARQAEVIGRLRFDVVTVEPLVLRPWIDVSIARIERAYYEILGTVSPEIFTPTFCAAIGRVRPVGIHISCHGGASAIKVSIGRHIDAFLEFVSQTTSISSLESWLRQQRFLGERHADWRLPIGLLLDGRTAEARQALDALIVSTARRPYGRRALEYRRLASILMGPQSFNMASD